MSDVDESAAPSGLSFERAEFDNQQKPTLSCGYCNKPLSVQYWQIAKRPACAECRGIVQRELEAGQSSQRFLGAAAYGAGAAILGCVGWLIVSSLFKATIGFVAIGVGYLVGKAVRKGARGQGGTRYQILALFLTYSAIALADLPNIISANPRESVASLVVFSYEVPFLGGTSNIIGLFIIGIGLYEAWKLTRALPLTVLGPYPIESAAPAELVVPPEADAAH
jgi:hypothetical protein